MSDSPRQVATNAITPIKAVLDNFSRGQPNHAVNVWESWSGMLGLAPEGHGSWQQRSTIVRSVSILVLPLCSRSRYQLGAAPNSTLEAIDLVESYLGQSIVQGSLGSADVKDKLKTLVSSTSALTTAEEIVSARWREVPESVLDEAESSIDDVRDVFQELVSSDQLDPLLAAPLDEALDWMYSGINMSRRFGALVGLGAGLRNIVGLGTELLVVQSKVGEISAPDGEVWLRVVEVLAVVELLAAIVVVAGYLHPDVLMLPPAATGLASLIRLSGRSEAVEARLREVTARIYRGSSPQALGPGDGQPFNAS